MAVFSGSGRNSRAWVGLATVFVLALATGTELARPFRSASLAFDSQMAVLHFERILAGRHLESFIATTPKPLLTVLYGVLHWLSGGWAAIAWATIGAYATAVVLSAVLAWRLAGPVAGTFSALAVLASPGLLFDVGFALATPWAAVGWLVAGLALTARRPRYCLAGVSLLLATLARLETVVPVGIVVLVLVTNRLAHGRARLTLTRPPNAPWLVPLIALLAIPVMVLHDALLTGDPLFWISVAGRYSAAHTLAVMTPFQVIEFLVSRYWSVRILTLLAVIGVIRLGRMRNWMALVGLVGFGPGIAAFLIVLAARGIFVSDRYAAAIDITVAFGAGIGAAGIANWAAQVVRTNRLAHSFAHRLGPDSLGIVSAAMAAVLIAGPYWRVDPALRPAVLQGATLAADEARSVPALELGLAFLKTYGGSAVAGAHVAPLIYVPAPILPRLIVDVGRSTLEIVGTDEGAISLASGYPPAGALVFHSLAGDDLSPGWADLETSTTREVGGVTIDPLLADPRAGIWVLRLRSGAPS